MPYIRGGGKQKLVQTSDFNISSLNGVAPDVKLFKRSSDSAILKIYSGFDVDIDYRVQIESVDGTKFEPQEFLNLSKPELEITELSPDSSYIITVEHKLSTEEDYGVKTTQFEIGAFEQYSTMEVSIEGTDVLIKNIPNEVSHINIHKIVNKDESTIRDVPVSGNETTIPIDKISEGEKSLATITLYAYFGEDSSKNISNTIDVISPLKLVEEPGVNWQSVILNIDLASDRKIEFSIVGDDSIEAKIDGSSVKLTGFNSNTTYSNLRLIEQNSPDYTSLELSEFVTKSFAGKYVWERLSKQNSTAGENKKLRFAVNVEEAPHESDYSYYVYFDKSDPVANGRADIRIMPLIDPIIDKLPIPDEFIKFESAGIYEKGNEAYELNSTKWNASPIKPSEWRIKKDSSVLEPDYVKTIVETKAKVLFIEILAETETSFQFVEQEINGQRQPTLVYRNLGVGEYADMVNGYLKINSEPREDYQEKDIFTFCLEKVNE